MNLSFYFELTFVSETRYFRNALRTFRTKIEDHVNGSDDFDLLRNNMRAVCLLTYLTSIFGVYICFDDEEVEFTIGDDFMFGSDLQYLLRYSLTIHLGSLKNQGNLYLFGIVKPVFLVFHGMQHNGVVSAQFHMLMAYFVREQAPTAFVVPNLSCFRLDGPGADGLEQGAGFFIGLYFGYCPVLNSKYFYATYTICFVTSFEFVPYETVYSEINLQIQPLHWVSYLDSSCYIFLFRCISNCWFKMKVVSWLGPNENSYRSCLSRTGQL